METDHDQCVKLAQTIGEIRPFDEEAARLMDQHSNRLTKPEGSLGQLEILASQLAGITGEQWPDMSRKAVIVMAGDHGVCEENVSAYPQEVTAQMVLNMLNGGAAVNVLAKQAGADLFCVDIGIKAEVKHPNLISRNVIRGTANMTKMPAMSREQAIEAIINGIQVVQGLVNQGYRLFATGEMGIGNTTASAAITSVLTGVRPEETVGYGTGINNEMWLNKVDVVKRAIAYNEPDPVDPFDVLSKIGGAEIAGLAGVILGAAMNRCPVVIDGFISSAAALLAVRILPDVSRFLIGSHLSQEQGHLKLLEELGIVPMMQLDMRLGEGTGAVLCFHFIDTALRLMKEMATFDSAGVSNK